MKKFKIEIRWGVIFTIVTLLWLLFERLMGWHGENIDEHASMTIWYAVPAILVYLFALLDKRKNDFGGVMTWLQGLMTGFHITLVVVALSPFAQLFIHNVITPDYFHNMIDYAVGSGNMERVDADEYFSIGNYIKQGLIGSFFMGVVTSALVAIFTRKSP